MKGDASMKRLARMMGFLGSTTALVLVFGMFQGETSVAQSVVLTVTPVNTTGVAAENTWICAKCGTTAGIAAGGHADDAKFTISVTDSAGNASSSAVEFISVSVKNTDLGTLGVATDANSNPKTITLRESGVNTGIFTRVVTAKGATTGLTANSSAPAASTTAVDVSAFTGQTIQVSYTPSGSLGVSKAIQNDEVAPSVVVSSPAADYITKKSTTIVFQAEITDGDSGLPAKTTSIVTNNGTGNKGNVQLHIGTSTVTLAASNYSAITGGYKLSASYASNDVLNIASKVPWWIAAEDLSGKTAEMGINTAGTASSTGSTTSLVDSNLAGMGTGSLIGRTVSITFAGTKETKAITAYTSGTGTLTTGAFSATIAAGTKYTLNKTGIITVDGVAPVLASTSPVLTGPNWSATAAAGSRLKTGLSGKRNSIRLTFTDASGIDSATVKPSLFAVTSNTVSAVTVVDIVGEDSTPSVQKVALNIFLTLGTDLVSSARPTVTISAGIKDKAGNALVSTSKKAADNLGPLMSVTLDKTLSNSKVKATIVTDELLTAAPTVTIKRVTNKTLGTVATVAGTDPSGSASQTGSLGYSSSSGIAAIGSSTAGNKFNLYLTGTDTVSNAGSTGHATNATKSTAITFELDQYLNNGRPPKVSVGDKTAQATTASATGIVALEQVDPIIVTVDFTKSCTTGAVCTAAGEDAEYVGDSYKTVELTSAVLKVTFSDATSETTTFDLASQVSSPDNKKFTIPLLAPKVGTYKLTIKAKDSAGNVTLTSPSLTTAQSLVYEWKVTAAAKTSVALSPGWNLISLPFAPANPTINSVIDAANPADLVMSYDNVTQSWNVSRRNVTSGLFEGDVAVITSTTSYFIHTTTFDPIKILRPALSTSAAAPPPPPAIAVNVGWNLVPVVSLSAPLPTEIKSDTYFGTLGTSWLKAMTYAPLTRQWQSVTRGTDAATIATSGGTYTNDCGVTTTATANNQAVPATVCIGKGYWLYSNKVGVIIP